MTLLENDREKALAVAKDVLARLELGTLQPQGDKFFDLLNWRGDLTEETLIDDIERVCPVCALGSLLLSKCRLYEGGVVDGHLQTLEDSDRPLEDLSDIFTTDQLSLIEAAFERRSYSWSTCLSKLTQAITLFPLYSSPPEKLKGIMENIISNEGEFVV